jgi:LysM repeat protein
MMSIALNYTILAGDTFSSIAQGVDACAGVGYEAIMAANPAIPSAALQPGQVLDVPATGTSTVVLRYTVRPGDSYYRIAANLAACAGVTTQEMVDANPQVNPSDLQIGQVIGVPAMAAPAPAPVPNIGYWRKTWTPGTVPAGATMGVAFSGYTDPQTAVQQSRAAVGSLVGTKFITLGGGNAAGAFGASSFDPINAAITQHKFAAYGGVAYDVEEGGTGLAQSFRQSFALAKANGFQVLVTVSHSAPYGIKDAPTLMQSFFADPNIDFLSPQLYTTGDETANDYATSHGVAWSAYAGAKAQIVPSIIQAAWYPNAQSYFAGCGVTTTGYVVWG